MGAPDVSVIVVSYNTEGLLRDCLTAVLRESAGIDTEIIVVDNNSKDGSAAMVRAEFPDAVLIVNNGNAGFGAASNQAATVARGRYLLLLNSDTVIGNGTMGELAGFLDRNPDAVGCSPALRLPFGRLQPGSYGYGVSLVTMFNHFFFLSALFPGVFRGVWQSGDGLYDSRLPVEAGWLCGACLMVRKDVFTGSGGFDTDFHMYSEDMELCGRLSAFGSLYFLPYAETMHIAGASSPEAQTLWLDSLFRLIGSRHGRAYALACRIVACAGFALRAVGYGAAGLLSGEHASRASRMAGYLRYCLSPSGRRG